MKSLRGKLPAVVKSYDKITRTCRVEIPGITSGGDTLLLAEILYPIGDKTRDSVLCTEIEIFENDTVWVEFLGEDSRYPIIVGWRNPQAGNGIDWRRWHHLNMEMIADNVMHLVVGNSSITLVPDTLTLAIGDSTIVMTNDGIHVNGTRVDLN